MAHAHASAETGTETPPDNEAGKHLIIKVPEHGVDPISGAALTTYLRLGAPAADPAQEPGYDLVEIAKNAGVGDSLELFDDDTRSRDGASPHDLSPGDRAKETGVLYTRGGWRDHSDGNRISTTRGDKVEVIRGNYKMVVLGRQDDPAGAAGWDVSGQNLLDFASGTCPGSTYEVTWGEEYGGSWTCEERSIYGVTKSLSIGDTYAESFGNFDHETTGSESPGDKKPNPEIIEKTWAKSIASYTGSPALPIPVISEVTHALVMTSATFGVTITDATTATDIRSMTNAVSTGEQVTVAGDIGSVTTAGTTTSVTTVAGLVSETTVGGALLGATTYATTTEMTNVGAGTSVTNAAQLMDIVTAANSTSITAGATATDVSVVGLTTEIAIGLAIGLQLAAKLDVFLGLSAELNLSGAFTFSTASAEISLVKTELDSDFEWKGGGCMLG